jgi:hypothetical protein
MHKRFGLVQRALEHPLDADLRASVMAYGKVAQAA